MLITFLNISAYYPDDWVLLVVVLCFSICIFEKKTLVLLACVWTLTFAGLREDGKYIETSTARPPVIWQIFPSVTPVKSVVVLSKISLTPSREG